MKVARRKFLKFLFSIPAGFSFLLTGIANKAQIAIASSKRIILPKETPLSEIAFKDPADLDIRELDTTPMSKFDAMGQVYHDVDLKNWHLLVTGAVKNPLKLSYDDILRFPAIERNVLLICYGFFAYNGSWRGISSADLLKRAGLKPNATRVKFMGPKGIQKQSRTFDISEVLSDKIFLAYHVNGKVLPERHGFPLRLIAENHYGKKWVKYVYEIRILEKKRFYLF